MDEKNEENEKVPCPMCKELVTPYANYIGEHWICTECANTIYNRKEETEEQPQSKVVMLSRAWRSCQTLYTYLFYDVYIIHI